MKKDKALQVFLPSAKDDNPFLDEIILKSEAVFSFGDLNSYKDSFPIILINWPEQLFKWKEPTVNDLKFLEEKFKIWQQKSHIVYVVHNFERHYGMTPNFEKLYELVIKYAKSMIHFGEFSTENLQKKHPDKRHQYIPHPLYETSFTQFDKNTAREQLGIPKNKVVIIAPGAIRNIEERNMVTKAFDKLKEKGKLLLVPKMFYKKSDIEFKGRTMLKKVVDVKKTVEYFLNENYKSNYYFNYDFLPFRELSLYMSASDIVLIPRIQALNSGNVFLGLTYNKIIVGPNVGNVKEVLNLFNLPSFNPNDIESVTEALEASIQLFKNNAFSYSKNKLNDFLPKIVAKKWDNFMKSLT